MDKEATLKWGWGRESGRRGAKTMKCTSEDSVVIRKTVLRVNWKDSVELQERMGDGSRVLQIWARDEGRQGCGGAYQ